MVWERREKVVEFQWYRKKSRLTPILTMKKINFGINNFHSTRGVYPRCSFSFTFPEMTDISSRMFLVLGWFWISKRIFELFEAIYKFIKVFMLFYRCFELKKKWIENGFYIKKALALIFFSNTVARILRKTNNKSLAFIFKINRVNKMPPIPSRDHRNIKGHACRHDL